MNERVGLTENPPQKTGQLDILQICELRLFQSDWQSCFSIPNPVDGIEVRLVNVHD